MSDSTWQQAAKDKLEAECREAALKFVEKAMRYLESIKESIKRETLQQELLERGQFDYETFRKDWFNDYRELEIARFDRYFKLAS